MKKDVIYIDVEDDITSIIDKMKKSKAKIVALVPPKRSTVLNSAVNAKLLMRAAKDASKRIVLITNDKALLSLAGGVGLHAAKNLQSKPYLPEAPEIPLESDNVIEGDLADLDPETAVGDLAGAAATVGVVAKSKKEDVKEKPEDKKGKKKGKKAFKIPNFERFRWKLFAGAVVLAILITGWIWAFKIAPKAEITIQTQTSQLDTVIDYTIDTSIEASDMEKKILAGEVKELKKTVTQEFAATGEKNVGERSTGTITVTNHCYNPGVIGTGTTFTSNSGLVFIATTDVSIADATPSAGSCAGQETTADVPVRAQSSGDNYNLAPTGYAVENFPSTDLSGFGSQMSGGTTEVKKVVSQEDYDKAKASFADSENDYSEEKLEMSKLFGEELIGMQDTFTSKTGNTSSTPAVGEEAEKAIMSVEMIFTEIGIVTTDVETLLAESQEPKIDPNTQSIYDNGLDSADYEMIKKLDNNSYSFKLRTIGIVGPNIDTIALAEQLNGKRYSEAKSMVDAIPGVTSSVIELSPFWVNKVPGPGKTTITVNISELGEYTQSEEQ